jgi:TPR repeat protein
MLSIYRLLMLISILVLPSCAIHNYNLKQGIESFQVQNYRQAFIRLLPEAKAGQPDAQYAVGYMYYYGQGVIENRKKAWYWINRAAVGGQPDARQAMEILKQGKSLGALPR